MDAPVRIDKQAGTAGITGKSAKPEERKKAYYSGHSPVVIVVDAGHGGKDTGAIGPSGLTEKEVTLALAKRLGKKIRSEPGMKLVMIRADDQFVDLSHRANIARHANADLFVSLHANAHDSTGISGSSVYILSDSRASTEAALWLSERENAALIGGVELADKNPELATVLLDLSKTATLESSEIAAMHVLKALGQDFPVHSREVQKPSLLVETAFITNPDEERQLRNPKFLDRMAEAIFGGIKSYVAERSRKQNISD
jgi:N-acetylmuramoyl-L-alanine amidase